jgi:hypothetical protein
VSHAVATPPVEAHLAMRQALIRRLRIVMPPLMVTAGGSVGLVALLQYRTGAFLPSCLSLMCAVVPIGVSGLGNGPLMLRVLTWSPDTPPADWSEVIDRWERLDTLRRTAAVGAFGCQVLAVLWEAGRPRREDDTSGGRPLGGRRHLAYAEEAGAAGRGDRDGLRSRLARRPAERPAVIR